MPLFSNKFSHRKTSPRKSSSLSNLQRDIGPQQSQTEFGIDYGPIVLNLGDSQCTFEDGKWVQEGSGEKGMSSKEIASMKRHNLHLKEENNLLKIKVEVLLDMLAEAMAETHLQTKEIDQLKDVLMTNKKHSRK